MRLKGAWCLASCRTQHAADARIRSGAGATAAQFATVAAPSIRARLA